MLELSSKIELLPKIRKPHIAALKKLKIFTVNDLLLHFPYRYLDFSTVKSVRDVIAGQAISLRVTIKSIGSRRSFRGGMALAEAVVSDASGSLRVVWFNQPYLAQSLSIGEEIFLSGIPEYYQSRLQLTNPIYEKVSDFPLHTARLVPVYHLTAGLYAKTLRNFIAEVLPLVQQVTDSLPQFILQHQNLLTIAQTIRFSHFPESLEQVEQAHKRLAFEEIFINQLSAQKYKIKLRKKKSYPIPFNQQLVAGMVHALPFTLTAGQKQATWEILQDLEKTVPMNRLLEADVGSGKTVVALLAAFEAVSEGFQVALLAPTEILAKQHGNSAQKLSQFLPEAIKNKYSVLTNHYSELGGQAIEKTKLQALITEGMPGLFIGTHALLAKNIRFNKLALVIIDEQHRFGVEQRSKLLENNKHVPHLLSLSATPIPRTLQLVYYGELSVSQIKSKPKDRKLIISRLVKDNDRAKAYEFISQQLTQGRQAFVITPLIEEGVQTELRAAKTEVVSLQKIFPKFRIGLLYGKLKGSEKEQVMEKFLSKDLDILVATSVVEVGVDVPNASVMVIEGADRFGLAQLHQFRGRVGRSSHQSYCLLFTENQNSETLQRLASFVKTHDGFELAELDLQSRGFGDFYGASQSGKNFKYFNAQYLALIPLARQEALLLLEQDLELKDFLQLRLQTEGKVIHFE